MGILPGRYQPNFWVRDVHYSSRMDCCPTTSGGADKSIEAVPFLLLCLIGLFVAGRFFWSVQEKEIVHSPGEMVPVS
jgi:hypothetical protein